MSKKIILPHHLLFLKSKPSPLYNPLMAGYLYTDYEGGQPALPPHGHAVGLAHVQAAEDALLQPQDLVHVVQELDAQLVELAGVVVTDPDH